MTWATLDWLPWVWVAASVLTAVAWRPRPVRALAPAPRTTWEAAVASESRRGRTGWVVAVIAIVGAAAILIDPRLAAAGGLAAWGGPRLRELGRRRAHDRDVRRELPEVIDLLLLGLAAGGSVSAAAHAVGRFAFGPVSSGLAATSRLVQRGHRLTDALERSLAPCGEPAVPLVRALVGADRYGTELRPVLERLAVEARDQRRRAAQADARRVPVRMLMPLVSCVLPAFILLSVVPVLAGTFDGLGLGGPEGTPVGFSTSPSASPMEGTTP